MGVLVRFDAEGGWQDTWVCDHLIAGHLERENVGWGRWDHVDAVPVDAPLDVLLQTLSDDLAPLRKRFGIRRIDRIRLTPEQVDWPWLRGAFNVEQTQAETEVRGFLRGAGLIHIRTATGFLGLLCEAGEWVALPAGTRHAFDAGDAPEVDVLRLFSGAQGGTAGPTGAAPSNLPLFDAFVDRLLVLTGHEGIEV